MCRMSFFDILKMVTLCDLTLTLTFTLNSTFDNVEYDLHTLWEILINKMQNQRLWMRNMVRQIENL